MVRVLMVGIVMLCLAGCVEMQSIVPQRLEEAYIQATRKTELVAGERVQVVLIATHLNAFEPKTYPHEQGEVFFIDVYQSAQNAKRFFENDYHLTLNSGDTPVRITPLKKDELQGFLRENASAWGEYYKVEFLPQDLRVRNSLQLILTHKEYGENFLNFGFKPLSKESLKEKR